MLILLDILGTIFAATIIMGVFTFAVAVVSFILRTLLFGITLGRADYLLLAEKQSLGLVLKRNPVNTTSGWTDEEAAESRRMIEYIDFLLEKSASTKQRISRRLPRC